MLATAERRVMCYRLVMGSLKKVSNGPQATTDMWGGNYKPK